MQESAKNAILGFHQATMPGQLADERGRDYDISRSYKMENRQINAVLKASETYADKGYNNYTRNCTTFAKDMGKIAGVPGVDSFFKQEEIDYTKKANKQIFLASMATMHTKAGFGEGMTKLTGGEPMLHSSFWPLARRIRTEGLRLGILTNGTLTGKAEAREFAALKPVFVQVSLDGTRVTHDAIRGEGAFDRALEEIDCLKRAGVHVLVSFTAQKGNYRDFPELSEICRKHRVDKLWWDRVVTDDTENLALSTDEFREMSELAAQCRKRYRQLNGSSMVNCGRALQFLATGRRCLYSCGAGGDLLIFLADGSIMPCRRLPFVIGNLRDGELRDILFKSRIMRQLAASHIPPECGPCPHRYACRGGSRCVTYARTGRLDIRDVNCRYSPEQNNKP